MKFLFTFLSPPSSSPPSVLEFKNPILFSNCSCTTGSSYTELVKKLALLKRVLESEAVENGLIELS